MNRRGISLAWTLSLAALFFTLALAAASRVDQARHFAKTQADQLRARSLAASGCRYARSLLRQGLWKGDETFRSPEMDGTFSLRLRRQTSQSVIILCRGSSGRVTVEQRSSYP
ncbi:MAG: hypothetical protein U0931_10960 [Vulcanimicrobiota bacterium]